MVSSNTPLPYPDGLRAYLSESWISREDVHAALGSPTLLRLEGELELYAARREVAAELIFRTRQYDMHYLLVRYRDDGTVLWLGEVVNAGCVPAGICVNRRTDNAEYGYWGGPDPGHIVLYADDAANQAAREAEPGRNTCIFYPEARDGKATGFPGLSIELPGHDPMLLPLYGFVTWSGDAQEHQLRVEFQSGGDSQESHFDFDCGGTPLTYYRLAADRGGFLIPSYAVELEKVDAPTGAAAIGSKWLILNH